MIQSFSTTYPRGAALGPVRWIALAALLTVGCAILLAHEGHAPLPARCAQIDAQKGQLFLTADARAAIDVETAAVEVRPIEERVLAYASIVAPWRSRAFAATRLPGRIVRVSVVPGQAVRAGDVIAEIQSGELDSLQLDLLSARNEIALSDKLVAELTRSAEAGAVPGQLVLDATARLAQNRNALELARSNWIGLGLPVEQLNELLAGGKPLPGLTLPVTAPVSGTVAHAELTAGKVIEPSEHLAEIIDLSTVWVRIDVLERDLHRVAVGMPVEILFAAYPSETFRAHGDGPERVSRPDRECLSRLGGTRQSIGHRTPLATRNVRPGVPDRGGCGDPSRVPQSGHGRVRARRPRHGES